MFYIFAKLLFFLLRVNRSQSLFETVPPCDVEPVCDSSELEMDRCECKRDGGAMSITCNLDLTRRNDINGQGYDDRTNEVAESSRKKRDLVYSDDVIYLYDDYEPEGDFHLTRTKRSLNTKMSLENATAYCRETILNTAAAKVCLEIAGVNASSAIHSCATDLQVRIIIKGFSHWRHTLLNNIVQ